MTQICPKCEYERTPADTAPDYECPRCGIVYAKYVGKDSSVGRSARKPQGVDAQDTQPFEHESPAGASTAEPIKPGATSGWSALQERSGIANRYLVMAAIAGLVVGYFAGREHLKYEIRTTISDTAERIFSGGRSSTPPKPAKKPTQAKLLTASLISKSYRDKEYGRAEITFSVGFKNETGRDIRAFDGVLTFTDLLGNEILNSGLAVNDAVAASQQLLWDGKLDYNQFKSDHERLRNAETDNTRAIFVVRKILFADGEVKEY